MKAPAFNYVRPDSLDETYALLARHADQARVLAGGQSLIPSLNMRLSTPALLVDINALTALSGISVDADRLRIGALTRHADIGDSQDVARHAPLLVQALPFVAHAAIRNRGTFGGSIAFADPAAEWPACCLALDASMVIGSAGGQRKVAATDFFRGLYETALAPTELLLAVEIPLATIRHRSAFLELARRHGDYAIVGIAAQARVDAGRLHEVRLGYFGMGATPILAGTVARALEGRACDADAIAAAQAALDADLDPFDDIYQTRATKMHLARVLTGRVLAALTQ